MKTFKEFINEAKNPKEIIANQWLLFLKDYFNITVPINIKIKKATKNRVAGSVDFRDVDKKKFIVTAEDAILPLLLGYITHEVTHINQILNKELTIDDNLMMYWKGKEIINYHEYDEMGFKDFNGYKELPWEKEAYENEATLHKKLFKKSKYYEELKGINPNIDFMIEYDAIVNI